MAVDVDVVVEMAVEMAAEVVGGLAAGLGSRVRYGGPSDSGLGSDAGCIVEKSWRST